MKTLLRQLLVIAFCLPLFLAQSCSSDDPVTPTPSSSYELSFVVNGGAFTNKTFTITGGASVYSPDDDTHAITFAGKDGSTDVGFNGWWMTKKTGTKSWENDDLFEAAGCGFVYGTQHYGCTTGTMSCTSIGEVGGDIVGTFSGTFSLFLSTEIVTVTNGRFRVKRVM